MAIDKRAARLGILALSAVVLFSLLGVRLWFLQTVKADELAEQVVFSSTRTVHLAPERGRIVDREGRLLAGNQRVLSVGLDWSALRTRSEREDLFERLSGWIDVPPEVMEERFDPSGRTVDPFRPYIVRRGIDEPTAIALRERIEDFPGVEIVQEWRRVYPYGQHAAHVVGYMGALQPEQVDDPRFENYLLDERVGQFGVERSMEQVLHGVWGYQVLEVDAANRPVRVIEEVPPINGFDVQLTIDLELQQYVEQTLESILEARRGQLVDNPIVRKPDGTLQYMDLDAGTQVPYKAPAGSMVVMDYDTGAVLAMASYPSFDPRWFEADISGDRFQELFPQTDDPDLSILVNRAIQGRYNLGSTFKPFTAYAALATGLLGAGDYYTDQGTYQLGPQSVDESRCALGVIRCEFRNATCGSTGQPCRYGPVNTEDALAVSSDTFFYRIGELIMNENDNAPILQEQVRLFGFGADTGVELPFEFEGTVPDRALKELYAERGVISEDEGRGYYVGDNVQLAIGQGLLSATPTQMTAAYGAIANGGFVLQPSVVQAIWNPGLPDSQPGWVDLDRGTVFEDRSTPILTRQIRMPDEIYRPLVEGLRRVIYGQGVQAFHTTGERLFVNYPRGSEAIPLAGKTGTAQGANNYPWNDSSAFTAFSTDDDRPYVVTAYLEKAGYGSQAAAPAVKCTFLAMAGLAPVDEIELAEPLDPAATAPANRQVMPDRNQAGGPDCWLSRDGNGVLTSERTTE